jgi:predicted nucleic acid-binding protein
MSFVLDNSVAMRWCFKTEAHPYADAILQKLAMGVTAIVPTLWFYEASAVLARAQNKGELSADKAAEFLAELRALNIIADEESGARAFTDVHRIAVAYRLTSYDAAYLELALRRNLPLASLDADLVRAAKSAGVRIFE